MFLPLISRFSVESAARAPDLRYGAPAIFEGPARRIARQSSIVRGRSAREKQSCGHSPEGDGGAKIWSVMLT